MVIDQVPPFREWHSTLISDHEGTNHITMSEGLDMDTSVPLGRNLDLENTKLLPEVLELHPSQCLHQYISYLFLCCNILELHCSSLHHIPDIVILDLDML